MLVPAEQSNAIVSPSGGPNGGSSTREGKEVALWNATRHGIRSPAPVVPGVEEAEEWEYHTDGFLDSLSPVGHLALNFGRKGGAALLEIAPRHPVRNGVHSALSGEGGG